MVKPSMRAALAEQVVAEIRLWLKNGRVKPGDRLPSERDLAEQLGISRTGIDTGLHLLAAMGVVEIRPGSGTYISAAPPELEFEPLPLLIPLQGFTAEEILVARRLLEVGLAGQAARNATEDDLASMAEEVTEMYASLDNRLEFLAHDIRFHRAIARAAGNAVLTTLTDMVSAVLYDVRREAIGRIGDLRPSVEMHRKIYGAVRSGNEGDAKAAMAEHLFLSEQDIFSAKQAR